MNACISIEERVRELVKRHSASRILGEDNQEHKLIVELSGSAPFTSLLAGVERTVYFDKIVRLAYAHIRGATLPHTEYTIGHGGQTLRILDGHHRTVTLLALEGSFVAKVDLRCMHEGIRVPLQELEVNYNPSLGGPNTPSSWLPQDEIPRRFYGQISELLTQTFGYAKPDWLKWGRSWKAPEYVRSAK